jgi:hypothetical protein
MSLLKCAYCNAAMSPRWSSCAACHRPLAGTASDAEPLPPEGAVGRHWRACPTCKSTWQWPTVSGKTGMRGWICATCYVGSGKPITVALIDQAAHPPGYETAHPQTGERFVTRLYSCPRCGTANWGSTGTREPDGTDVWACLTCRRLRPVPAATAQACPEIETLSQR